MTACCCRLIQPEKRRRKKASGALTSPGGIRENVETRSSGIAVRRAQRFHTSPNARLRPPLQAERPRDARHRFQLVRASRCPPPGPWPTRHRVPWQLTIVGSSRARRPQCALAPSGIWQKNQYSGGASYCWDSNLAGNDVIVSCSRRITSPLSVQRSELLFLLAPISHPNGQKAICIALDVQAQRALQQPRRAPE